MTPSAPRQASPASPWAIPASGVEVPTPLTVEDILDNDVLVRQSIANGMQNCPASVGYALQEGFIDVFGEQPVYGTITHKLVELHIEDPHGQGARTKPQAINKIIDEVLAESYASTRDDLTELEFKKLRRLVIEAYRLWVLQVYEPLLKEDLSSDSLTEYGMWVHIGNTPDGRRIILHGTADLVIPDQRIEDFKTTNAAFKWNEFKADTEIQPTFYLAMWNIINGTELTDWRYRIYDRKKEDWNSLDTERTLAQQKAGILLAYEYGLQIAANAFPATPVKEEFGKAKRGWYCSAKWCGAWNICEFKGLLNDGVNLTEVKIKKWS